MLKVSAVIPTKNRHDSLLKTLESLNLQDYLIEEVIILDSSNKTLNESSLKKKFKNLNLIYLKSKISSVCYQRNIGIQYAKGEYIFLCDDDIITDNDYITTLLNYLQNNPEVGCVTGLCLEKNKSNTWIYQYPPASFTELLFLFIFQHSIWGNIDKIKTNVLTYLPYKIIQKFYKIKRNTFSLAAWPINTNYGNDVFKVSFYPIGAAIIKKTWLLQNKFDEVLDPSGIGDNYGVILNFPELKPVHIIPSSKVYHYKCEVNRLVSSLSYYRRLLALDYFITINKRYKFYHKLFFLWSLFGKILLFLYNNQKKMLKATYKAFLLSLFNKNPYLIAKKMNKKYVCPEI